MNIGKRHIDANKTRKHSAAKQSKKQSVKLSSEGWYKKAAAALSIRNPPIKPSPSLVPEMDPQ